MTQSEFDTLMADIRREQSEFKAQAREELAEVEERRKQMRQEFDEAHNRYQAICAEQMQKQKEVKEKCKEFATRKQVLIQTFPDALGTRTPGSYTDRHTTEHKCFSARGYMMAYLTDKFKDTDNVNVGGISVQFRNEVDGITFVATIPTK